MSLSLFGNGDDDKEAVAVRATVTYSDGTKEKFELTEAYLADSGWMILTLTDKRVVTLSSYAVRKLEEEVI